MNVARLCRRALVQRHLERHAPVGGGLGSVGEKVLLCIEHLGRDVLPRRARVVGVIADLDRQVAAGWERALNVDDRLGRHIVGRQNVGREGYLRHRLGEGHRPRGRSTHRVGRRDGERVVSVEDAAPLGSGEGQGVRGSERRRVRSERGAVELLDHRHRVPVGVRHRVVVGRRGGGEAAEAAVGATDHRVAVIRDCPGVARCVPAFGAGCVVCLDAVADGRPAERDGVGVCPRAALVDLRPRSPVILALQPVA